VGLIPTGSKDPLALRRAGQGIVRILWERGWALTVEDLVDATLKVIATKATKPEVETREVLLAFFRDRVAYQLELAEYSGKVRRATLGAGWMDLLDLKARCDVLKRVEADPSFDSLKESAKRIGNILKDGAPVEAFDKTVLVEPAEIDLYNRLIYLESVFGGAQYRNQYQMICGHLAELSEPLEVFFNAVMVKCEDPALRAARLSLLHRLRQAFLRVADFSLWQ
jgi:glycyl-tRNA synthetase beta chain